MLLYVSVKLVCQCDFANLQHHGGPIPQGTGCPAGPCSRPPAGPRIWVLVVSLQLPQDQSGRGIWQDDGLDEQREFL